MVEKFYQLQDLKQEDGSFLTPTCKKLSNWMRHQIEYYAASLANESGQSAQKLKIERMKMLKEIGFLNEAMN